MASSVRTKIIKLLGISRSTLLKVMTAFKIKRKRIQQSTDLTKS